MEPQNKKWRLSLSLRSCRKLPLQDSNNRFAQPTSKEDFLKAAEGVVPSNTMQNNRWAETTFIKWAQKRNKRAHSHDGEVPLDLLQSHDAEKVCKFMRYFVLEARCEDGDRYPACTIRSLLSAFNQTLRANDAPFCMLDKKDITFLILFAVNYIKMA